MKLRLIPRRRVFGIGLVAAIMFSMGLTSKSLGEPRKFHVYLAYPKPQYIPDEEGSSENGGLPADITMMPNPANVGKHYFDPVIGGLDGVGNQQRIHSFVEWWYHASYGQVTIEDLIDNPNLVFGWFPLPWPITPKNDSGDYDTPEDFVDFDANGALDYGKGESFFDGLSMILMDTLGNDGPPNATMQFTPASDAGEGTASDGAWTPGERFMDLDSDERYDSALDFYTIMDMNGDCICSDPSIDIDALRYDPQAFQACEQVCSSAQLPDMFECTNQPGVPGPCEVVAGCCLEDFVGPDNEARRPEPYEDFLVFRDRAGKITNGGEGYMFSDFYYQPIPDAYIRDNYPGDYEALLQSSGYHDGADTGNNRYDPPERWTPSGDEDYVIGDGDFDDSVLNDEGQFERNLEEMGSPLGSTTGQPFWYEEFWRIRYGLEDGLSAPAWPDMGNIPNLDFFDGQAASELESDGHPDRINFSSNRGGRKGYGTVCEQEAQLRCGCPQPAEMNLTLDCDEDGEPEFDETPCAELCQFGDGSWEDPEQPNDEGGRIYPTPLMNYNGPKEHDDLPSSLYHAKFVVRAQEQACPVDDNGDVVCCLCGFISDEALCTGPCTWNGQACMNAEGVDTCGPEHIDVFRAALLDYGGNQTFGEVTSTDPYTENNRNPWGAILSFGGGDGEIPPAGPLAGGTPNTSIHGALGANAGNVMTLEYQSWVRVLDSDENGELDIARSSPLDFSGLNEPGAGEDFFALRPEIGFADFDLDGLLDLGEGVPWPKYRDTNDDGAPDTYVGVENYAVDAKTDGNNDGIFTDYPYNRQRLIEDVMEVVDSLFNFSGQLNNYAGRTLDGITLLPGGLPQTFDLGSDEIEQVDGGVFSSPVGTGNFMPVLDLMPSGGTTPIPEQLLQAQVEVWDMPILLDRGHENNVEAEAEGKYKKAFAIHEFGHRSEGWPDLYDTTVAQQDIPEVAEDPMNGWDIMDNGDLFLPMVNTMPISKENSGWITPIDLTTILTPGVQKTITIVGCEAPSPANSYYVFPNQFAANCSTFTNQTACNNAGACSWDPDTQFCSTLDCSQFGNQQECNAQSGCEWGFESNLCQGGAAIRERFDFWAISDTRGNEGNLPMIGDQYPWGDVQILVQQGNGPEVQLATATVARADACVDGTLPSGTTPRSGLLIMKSNLGADQNALPPQQAQPNNVTYGLVQADGMEDLSSPFNNSGDNADLWPGTCGVTEWSSDTFPNNSWQTQLLGISGIEIQDLIARNVNPVTGFASVDVTFFWQPQDTASLTFENVSGTTSLGTIFPLALRAYDIAGGTRVHLHLQEANQSGQPQNNYAIEPVPGGSIAGQPSPFLKLTAMGPKDKTGIFNVNLSSVDDGTYFFYAFLEPTQNELKVSKIRRSRSASSATVSFIGDGEGVTLDANDPDSARIEAWSVRYVGNSRFDVEGSMSGCQTVGPCADIAPCGEINESLPGCQKHQAVLGELYATTNPPGALRFTVEGSLNNLQVGDTLSFTTPGWTPYSEAIQVSNNGVGARPNADFVVLPSNVGPIGFEFTFDAGASINTPGVPGGLTYRWDFDDGTQPTLSAVPTIVHSFDLPGTYEVNLTVTNDLEQFDSITRNVLVQNTAPNVDLTTSPSPASAGLLPFLVSFMVDATDPDGDDITTFEFDFQYLEDGTLSACQSNASSFAADVTTSANPGNNGQASVDVDHTYANVYNGLAAVRVSDSAGSRKLTCVRIDAGNQRPNANVSVVNRQPTGGGGDVPVFEGFAPLTIHFNGAQSSDPDFDELTYAWDFGDGNEATGVSVTHTFLEIGLFMVTLTVSDPDGATDTDTVFVQVLQGTGNVVTASISAEPRLGPSPLRVSFAAIASDLNGAQLTYAWDFGDSQEAFGRTTDHTFVNPSDVPVTFTVTLLVTADDGGAQDMVTETITVLPEDDDDDDGPQDPNLLAQLGLLAGSNSVGVAPHFVQFDTSGSRSLDDTPVTVRVSFGDGSPAVTALPRVPVGHTYDFCQNPDPTCDCCVYQATATTLGTDDRASQSPPVEIRVFASGAPVASIAANVISGTAPLTVTFDASESIDPDDASAALDYEWDFGDGTPVARIALVEHTFNMAGTYTVQLKVTDPAGSADSATIIISVDPLDTGNGSGGLPGNGNGNGNGEEPQMDPAGACGVGCGAMGAAQLLMMLLGIMGMKTLRQRRSL